MLLGLIQIPIFSSTFLSLDGQKSHRSMFANVHGVNTPAEGQLQATRGKSVGTQSGRDVW